MWAGLPLSPGLCCRGGQPPLWEGTSCDPECSLNPKATSALSSLRCRRCCHCRSVRLKSWCSVNRLVGHVQFCVVADEKGEGEASTAPQTAREEGETVRLHHARKRRRGACTTRLLRAALRRRRVLHLRVWCLPHATRETKCYALRGRIGGTSFASPIAAGPVRARRIAGGPRGKVESKPRPRLAAAHGVADAVLESEARCRRASVSRLARWRVSSCWLSSSEPLLALFASCARPRIVKSN